MAVKVIKGVGTTLDVDIPYIKDEENHAQRVAAVMEGDFKDAMNAQTVLLGRVLNELININAKLEEILN